MKIHEKFMERCLQLAKNGWGTTYPNPMVGCVIVKDGKIIAEGWHHHAGGPHAEAHAIMQAKADELKGATLYVNLEPCNHIGRTGACAPLLASHGITTVVIGCIDSNKKVNGSGIDYLKGQGLKVITGVLKQKAQALNKRFFRFHRDKRPHLVLKWAQTKNQFFAPHSKEINRPAWISNAYSRQHAHSLRSKEQAILVGYNTWLEDQPKLTAYRWNENNPTKVVLGGSQRPTKEVLWIQRNRVDTVGELLHELYKNDIQSVLVEGGAKTLQQFIDADLWDECYVYQSPNDWNEGLKAPRMPGNPKSLTEYGTDELLYFSKE